MSYFFWTTDLIRFIFSYTQCTSMKYDDFYKFWSFFTALIPKSSYYLDFGCNYHSNWSEYEDGFEELSQNNHPSAQFFYLPRFEIYTNEQGIGRSPISAEYSEQVLDHYKKHTPELIEPLLAAIEHIHPNLSFATNQEAYTS